MSIRPISYVKSHPGATLITFIAGMAIGPWLFGAVGSKTGFNVSIPSYGGSGD